MNIVVCVKRVPDTAAEKKLDPSDFTLDRDSVESIMNPVDEYAVEEALKLKEQHGGEVTILTVGPEGAEKAAVRKALALGADKGVLVTDDALRGADTLATATVLSAAIQLQEFDLVFAAVESTDGYTGTLPQTLAEFLGIPALTFARSFELTDGGIKIERQTESGYQVVESALPALVTVTAGATTPRYPTLKGIMAAKQKPVERPSLADLGLTAESVQATQAVSGVEPAPERQAGEVVEDGEEAVQKVVTLLKEAKVI